MLQDAVLALGGEWREEGVPDRNRNKHRAYHLLFQIILISWGMGEENMH